MPVVELCYDRLCRLVGGGATKRAIEDALPHLGLDIEGRGPSSIRVEYSPNRPDYSTDWGIAAGLRGLLAAPKGGGAPRQGGGRGGPARSLRADPSVAAVRPCITMIAAAGGRLDGHSLAQLVSMQEDLHDGVGRRRKKASIGLHDMAAVRFPLAYVTAGRGHKFVPLGHAEEMTAREAISRTKAGAEYGGLLAGAGAVPLVVDAAGTTLSLPPVINGAATALTESTTGVLVEVTGTDRTACESALSVAAMTLQLAGFALEGVRISGAGNRTPDLAARPMPIDARLVSRSLGFEMPVQQVAESLRRAGLGPVAVRGTSVSCSVPRHRFDILGPMDLVEEVALGYGVRRIEPVFPASPSVGMLHPSTALARAVRLAMVGLGYTEALSPSLSSARVVCGRAGRGGREGGEEGGSAVAVLDSKSSDHAVLRDSLLPGLLDALSRNVHEPYPQRLFEIGVAFTAPGRRGGGEGGGGSGPPTESTRLCAVVSHSAASYTEIKSALLAVSNAVLGGPCATRAADGAAAAPLAAGRSASVHAGQSGAPVGAVGEIDAGVARELRIRQPAAAFEVGIPFNTTRLPPSRPKSRHADGPR